MAMNTTLTFSVIITSVILVSGTLGIVLSNSASAAPEEKLEICHIPPGNPANVQIITVGIKAALNPHFQLHGDSLAIDGNCNNLQCKNACTFQRVSACFFGEDPIACFERNFDSIDQCSQNCDNPPG